MTALIFTGGLFPSPDALENLLENLGKNSSIDFPELVIAADSGLEMLEKYNETASRKLKPYFITGDMDSIKDKKLLEKYSEAQKLFFIQDKDYTDTELSLIKARELNASFVILAGGDGLRTDHFLSVFDSFNFSFSPDLWLTSTQSLWLLKSEAKYELTNLKPKEYISFLRPSSDFNRGFAETEGLKWEGSLFRKQGMASISNRIDDSNVTGKIKFQCHESNFIAILPQTAFVRKAD